MQQMLATYTLTGEKKYLEPIEVALEMVNKFRNQDTENSEIGSEAWVAEILRNSEGFGSVTEQWRIITGDKTYDNVLMTTGSDYLKYRISGDKEHIVRGSQRIIDGIISGKELVTTEGYYTDRIRIGNIHNAVAGASSHLESVYLGSALDQGFHPFYHISWSGFSDDFASLVIDSDQQQLKLLVYNFREDTQEGKLNFWHLLPGKYSFHQGNDMNEDDSIDELEVDMEFEINQRFGSVEISIPPKQLQVINISQEKSYPQTTILCDLAINADEIVNNSLENGPVKISLPVHNIGNTGAKNIKLGIYDGGVLIKDYIIEKLDAPLSLESATVMLEIEISGIQNNGFAIKLDPDGHIDEITLNNNTVFYQLNE